MNHWKILPILLLTNLVIISREVKAFSPLDSVVVDKLSDDQFYFLEGPVWYGDSVLYFTDLGTSPKKIIKYSPMDSTFTVVTSESNGANGLTLNKQGDLIACLAANGLVAVLDHTGKIADTLANGYNSVQFNSPNDLIADGKGGVYFTDPVFGGTLVQDHESVYYISPAGLVTPVINDLQKPNGVILSEKGDKLYVVDSFDKYVFAYQVQEDGMVAEKSQFAELLVKEGEGTKSYADGMAIDTSGTLFVATQLGIQVFDKTGNSLPIINVPEKPTNCDFGGKDMKTLFITAGHNLYSAQMIVPGFTIRTKENPVDTSQNTTSIKTKEMDFSFAVFPNPVNEKLHLSFNNTPREISIHDMTGKLIFLDKPVSKEVQVNVSTFEKGIYIINARCLNPHHVYSKKCLIE